MLIIFTLVILFCSSSIVEPRYLYNSQKVSTEYNFMSLIRYILSLTSEKNWLDCLIAKIFDNFNLSIYHLQISSIKICKILPSITSSGWQPMKICTWKPASTQNHNYWAYVHFPFNGRNIYLREGMHRLSRFHCHE